jgi:flagellar assembly protein FliH
MTQQSADGVSQQPARLLRSPAAAPAGPSITAIAWRSAGHAALPAARTTAADRRSAAEASSPEAEREIQRRLEAARQQGRVEGDSIGAQRAGQRLDPVIASLSALLSDLAQQRPRLRAETEEDTVKLALAIARRVLHRELSADPEALLGLVKAAFQKLNARETHRLRVSPPDAAALQEYRTRLELPPGLEIASDPSLPRGSAVFETSRGELDASVDTQIGEIERGLTDVMRRRAK